MDRAYLGEAVRRVEDHRLLSGLGRFTDDIVLPNMMVAAFLRSPHAHAQIDRIDTAPAERAPEMVRHDVAEGYVSPERAREVYGVVIDEAGELDVAATATLRARS